MVTILIVNIEVEAWALEMAASFSFVWTKVSTVPLELSGVFG